MLSPCARRGGGRTTSGSALRSAGARGGASGQHTAPATWWWCRGRARMGAPGRPASCARLLSRSWCARRGANRGRNASGRNEGIRAPASAPALCRVAAAGSRPAIALAAGAGLSWPAQVARGPVMRRRRAAHGRPRARATQPVVSRAAALFFRRSCVERHSRRRLLQVHTRDPRGWTSAGASQVRSTPTPTVVRRTVSADPSHHHPEQIRAGRSRLDVSGEIRREERA